MEPSSLRAAFVVDGTRGDIQPYVALALHLHKRGNVVQLFTNVNHVSFCNSFGLRVDGVLYDSVAIIQRPEMKQAMVNGNAFALQKGLAELRKEYFAADIKRLFDSLKRFEPTVLIYGKLSRSHCCMYSMEYTIPAVSLELQIMLPLTDQAPVGLPTLPCGLNRLWFRLFMMAAGKTLPDIVARAKEGLGLDFSDRFTLEFAKMFVYDIPSLPTPTFYGTSSVVIPPHPEWPRRNFNVCGFFVIDKCIQQEMMKDETKGADFGVANTEALAKFLATGKPPVYMGWGSMVCKSAEWMVATAVEALKHVGARGVLLGGWSGLGLGAVPPELQEYCRENVLFVPSAAHEWLFPQCACIVHHGGSGTTAASVRSGRPTIITPIMGDQFDFADGVNRVGCGVGLRKFSSLTSIEIGSAIRKCLEDPGIIEAAAQAGGKLQAEDACANFCKVFDDWYTSEYLSGEWLKKHNNMLQRCKKKPEPTTCGTFKCW